MSANFTLQDAADISALINGWIYRDTARWDKLRGLFHPGGIIEVGWFKGLFSDFVDASIAMQNASAIQSKHLMATPLIEVRGDRAVAETNAILTGINNNVHVGFTAHTRFYDLIERRDGVWKISKRNNIYDMCFLSFPAGLVPIDEDKLTRQPWEYAPLAYVIEASGHSMATTLPTRGSEFEASLRQAGERWLDGR